RLAAPRKDRRDGWWEAEPQEGGGDGRDVGRRGRHEQVDDVLASQAGHGRAAYVLGWGGWPAGGEQCDQAGGHLRGVRVGLVDLDRDAVVGANWWMGGRGHGGLGR